MFALSLHSGPWLEDWDVLYLAGLGFDSQYNNVLRWYENVVVLFIVRVFVCALDLCVRLTRKPL